MDIPIYSYEVGTDEIAIKNAGGDLLCLLTPTGGKADGNPTFHDKYTDAEVLSVVLATDLGVVHEYICFAASVDDQTVKLGPVANDCEVINISYFTAAALGSGAGIDLIDGGTDGDGTDVIDASDDNLEGLDNNELGTPYALSAGDHLNITLDDFTSATLVIVKVTLEVTKTGT